MRLAVACVCVCVTRAAEPRTHGMGLVSEAGLAGQRRVALLAVGLGALPPAQGTLLAGCRTCAPLGCIQTGAVVCRTPGAEQKP